MTDKIKVLDEGVDGRYALPKGNWVQFEGELKMKDVWAIMDAARDENADPRILAQKLPAIISGWSFTGDEGHPLDPKDPDSYGELGISAYKALADKATDYIGKQAEVGN